MANPKIVPQLFPGHSVTPQLKQRSTNRSKRLGRLPKLRIRILLHPRQRRLLLQPVRRLLLQDQPLRRPAPKLLRLKRMVRRLKRKWRRLSK